MSLTPVKPKPKPTWEEIRAKENVRLRPIRNKARDARRRDHDITFVAVDGEGIGVGHDHKYVLLGIGDQQIVNPDGIPWWDVFEHLYSAYKRRPEATFVGFFLGYDFTQILKGIPYDRALSLLSSKGIKARQRNKSGNNHVPFSVVIDVPDHLAKGCDHAEGEIISADHAHERGRYWQFDLLPPARRWRGRPKYCRCRNQECEHQTGVPWMYVCDAGPFFQTSLMSAIDPRKWPDGPIVTNDEYALLKAGKEHRDNAQLDDDMMRYNRLENDVLSRLMVKLNQGFTESGILLGRDQWFGPGQAAQKWMTLPAQKSGLVSRTESVVPKWVRDAAQFTYYGGWFEIFAHGIVPGTSWEYDVNSAYPFNISELPCLEHGEWIRGDGYPSGPLERGRLRIVHVTVCGGNPKVGPVMYRNAKGGICRPLNAKGWYWQDELNAAIDAGLVDDVQFHDWIEYLPCDCPPPLRGLRGLYDQRLAVGKDTSHGKALKLTYNSIYGKFAQSVGEPRYGNPVYASRITSGCRTMILKAIASHPHKTDDLIMVATDGVYFRTPHTRLDREIARYCAATGKNEDDRIGKWSRKELSNLTLFKPGVYWHDGARERIARGETPEFKSRGVSARALAKVIGEADQKFRDWNGIQGEYPKVTFKSGFSMVTLQQALQGKKLVGEDGKPYGRTWNKAGYVYKTRTLTQDSHPEHKRFPILQFDSVTGIYWSRAHEYGSDLETTPYDCKFGFDEEENQEYGLTPDGSVFDSWKHSLLEK
jgi:hypothetical protein